MNDIDNINNYMPSLLNPRSVRNENLSLTQNSIISSCSLSLKKISNNNFKNKENKVYQHKKEIVNVNNITAIEKHLDIRDKYDEEFDATATNNLIFKDNIYKKSPIDRPIDVCNSHKKVHDNILKENVSSANSTVNNFSIYNSKTTFEQDSYKVKTPVSISFGISNCKNIYVYSKKSNLKGVSFQVNENDINVDCELSEGSQLSEVTIGQISNMAKPLSSPLKRKSVAVNLEIKKMKLAAIDKEMKSKVLFLNTNAIEELVIEEPSEYKLLKTIIINNHKLIDTKHKILLNDDSPKLKQLSVDKYFKFSNLKTHLKSKLESKVGQDVIEADLDNDKQDMSRNSVQGNVIGRTSNKYNRTDSKSPESLKIPKLGIRPILSEAKRVSSSRSKQSSAGSCSPRKNRDSPHLGAKSNVTSTVVGKIPHYKIVAGTHFAVDAFEYGEIPNVKHYFLTHFHSDHYSGLQKTFNKFLYCSKITANLCKSRLGVKAKCINIIDVDETIRIDGVEITAVDANHCPGALMLVFTLPDGTTLLHTGDFRATHTMESYPVFWNKDIHTIYLDTTYCNPRYDFPTQDESIDMAVHLLRQKKMAVEKAGGHFSSVLIVCGTYIIGKEKFYEGVARRVGCAVWAPARAAPPASAACQLHLRPMRDLTHEKLRVYLNSFNGAFTEVVAFKPSGWETVTNSFIEKDSVTIHGIPYSEHSSFSEMVRFVKFLRPRRVVPIVEVPGGVYNVQEYFIPYTLDYTPETSN